MVGFCGGDEYDDDDERRKTTTDEERRRKTTTQDDDDGAMVNDEKCRFFAGSEESGSRFESRRHRTAGHRQIIRRRLI